MPPLDELQEDVAPEAVSDLHARGEITLIDVREPYEHEAGHIAGSRRVDPADLPAFAGEIAKDEPVVFYCRTGARSAMATQAFRASGYSAANMAGGMVAWAEKGMPIEPADGTVAPH